MMKERLKGISKLEWPDEYIIVDVETTGLDSKNGHIIEIAAIKVHNRNIVSIYESLINPNCIVPPFIEALTGISNEMLSGAPCASDVLTGFFEFSEEYIIIGHNVHFDINFIYDVSLREINKHFTNDFVDTLRWSRILIKDSRNHKLGELADHLNLSFKPSHRAMTDCLTTYELYEYLRVKKHGKNNINNG